MKNTNNNELKIIFLDVDGVLNSQKILLKYRPGGIIGTYDEFLDRLEKLVKATRAKIVLSSSWRKIRGCEHYQEHITDKFKPRNIEIIGYTPGSDTGERGLEILEWIKANNFTGKYVVIDDEVSDIIPYVDNSKLVVTTFETGLLTRHINKAIKILSK